MKKVTKVTVRALFNKETLRHSNTEVEYILQPHLETSEMWLHGNLIARYNHRAEELQIFNCGWFTQVTKERLNGVLSYFCDSYIRQKDFKWYVVTPLGEIEFEEGMILDENGLVEEVA